VEDETWRDEGSFLTMNNTQPLDNLTIEVETPTVSFSTFVPPNPIFTHYDGRLSEYREMNQRWLWKDRIPLGGVTLLDGDFGTGKSTLAQLLAAHVTSEMPLPDGSHTIRGGVVIVAPYEEAGKAMSARLVAHGADTSRIRIISFVQDTSPRILPFSPGASTDDANPIPAPPSYRHFQLPDDLELLRAAMQEVDARLVILDPFMETLPDEGHMTQEKLRLLLRKLHQVMLEMDATCLLIRQCPAKGGTARPTGLESSAHFLNVASSRLLLAQDPTQPGHLLLSHVACRIQGLAPTLCLTITSVPHLPRQPRVTFTGTHALQAQQLLHVHPGVLHLQLLAPRLVAEIAVSPEPVTLASLRPRFPHSTPSQLQRTLRQLVQEGILLRIGRSLYTVNSGTT
jgi:AAA domain